MANERAYSHRLTIAIIAAMLLATTVTSVVTTSENAFASNSNQVTASANDCGNGQMPTNVGCQNIGSQIQGDGNSVALAAQQTFPATATGFTVTGSGTGSSERITCPQGPFPPGQYSVEFSAQSDGTTSGTYTLSVTDSMGTRVIREGVFTVGTTDGSTYSFGGRDNLLLCNDFEGNLNFGISGISGDCGDDVTIIYSDETSLATFTGNVECTLT
jgi:hypothetical protein